MRKRICACLAVLMCLLLLGTLAPIVRADAGYGVEKDGAEVTSPDELKVNDIVTFGHYAYREKGDNAEIEWIVLDVHGSRATLLSRAILDSRPYHRKNEQVSWQTSELNEWLNGAFLSEAFTAEEQALLSGPITVPSMEEAMALTMDQRRSSFTPYAVAQGGDSERNIWWLRDGVRTRPYNGEEITCASVVQQSAVWEACYLVTFRGKGVRPLVKIDFERGGQDPDADLTYPGEETGLLMKGRRTVTSADELELYDDVIFGAYPQSGSFDESIHWLVIGKEGTKVRLLSTLALDSLPYQTPYGKVAWEESSLFAWLNGRFMEMAFAPVEQGLLSEDITLLGLEEARKLPEEILKTRSTPYAALSGADGKRCIWWLKDAFVVDVQEGGKTSRMYCGSVVLDSGTAVRGAYRVDLGHKTVRPVIEIDLALLPH